MMITFVAVHIVILLLLNCHRDISYKFSSISRVNRRTFDKVFVALSEDKVNKETTAAVPSGNTVLRYLEANSWELRLGDINIAIDPVFDQLDFGVPALYRGNRKYLDSAAELKSLAVRTDFVFISQGFDDHAHKPTLKKLVVLNNSLRYLCPPSAKKALVDSGINEAMITTILPGQNFVFSKDETEIEVVATTGALLGPPWQQKENGYIMRPTERSSKPFKSVYYEPHCMFDEAELSNYTADVVITPVVSVRIPNYTILGGGPKALQLAELLKASYIVPMSNWDLEERGLLKRIVRLVGSEDSFKNLVKSKYFLKPKIQVVSATPGQYLNLQ